MKVQGSKMALKEYISKEKIEELVSRMGSEISADYKDEEIVVVGVLNGSFIFLADLIRKITVPTEVEFISASSYGEATQSSGTVKIELDLRASIEGKHILLVEDIIDTGLTIKYLKELLESRKPKSVKVASLLFKPSRQEHEVDIDYLGTKIEDKFVIGYGLDFAGKYRGLPYLAIYQE